MGAELRALLRKELMLEWRQKSSLGGLLLYVLSLVFVSALNLRGLNDPTVWNVLYWLLVVFAALNAVAKSFLGESDGQLLYLYQLASPTAVILAKTLYNGVLLTVLALLSLGIQMVLLKQPMEHPLAFLAAAVLGSVAVSSTLTLISALTQKAGGKPTLMAVLGLPLLVPCLLTLTKMSHAAILGVLRMSDAGVLLGLSGVATTLSVVLFPYLWRE